MTALTINSSLPSSDVNGTTTLMIDNYDSFTYNVVQYLSQLGAIVKTFRNDECTLDQLIALKPSRLVISPGPGSPSDAGISNEAIKYFAGKIPILGVCLGHQCIIEVFGGRVSTHSHIMHGKTSQMIHDGKGIFEGLPTQFKATRYHSLIGDISKLPNCLEITCHCAETEPINNPASDQYQLLLQSNDLQQMDDIAAETLQGVRHKEFIIEGVQFHPESISTEYGLDMLNNFLQFKGGKWNEMR